MNRIFFPRPHTACAPVPSWSPTPRLRNRRAVFAPPSTRAWNRRVLAAQLEAFCALEKEGK